MFTYAGFPACNFLSTSKEWRGQRESQGINLGRNERDDRETGGKEGRDRLAVEEIENEGKNEGIEDVGKNGALKQNGAITTATKGTREARERKNERKRERGERIRRTRRTRTRRSEESVESKSDV